MGEAHDPELAATRERGAGLVHEGGRLEYVPGSRVQCRALLRAAVQDRMTQIAGGQITSGGRGIRVTARPDGGGARTGGAVPGRPWDQAGRKPGSPGANGPFRVGLAPGLRERGPDVGTGRVARDRLAAVARGVLSAEFKSFLGNLPQSTQVQVPFAPQPDLRYSFCYEVMPGSPHTWIGLCYIADQRTLTFASATKIIAPSGAARSWQATCYQATLATPMPAPWRPVPRRRAAGRKPGQFRHNRLRLAEVLHRCEVAKDESRA